jgi:hypothetical protein
LDKKRQLGKAKPTGEMAHECRMRPGYTKEFFVVALAMNIQIYSCRVLAIDVYNQQARPA